MQVGAARSAGFDGKLDYVGGLKQAYPAALIFITPSGLGKTLRFKEADIKFDT